jgi:hypothetical protein
MKNVKFLHTSAGTYGIAHEGDELTLNDAIAAKLEKQGTVEITGDAGDDAEESVAPVGSVRITDETGKTNTPAGETNPKNPTGPDKKVTVSAKPVRGATKPSKK